MPCAFHAERPFPFRDLPPGCQFDVPEDELIEVDGQRWCPFHAPLKDKDGNGTEKAGWDEPRIAAFMDRINGIIQNAIDKNEAADLTGVVFPGAVDFSKKQIPRTCFYKAQFSGNAWFTGAQFSGYTDFREAQFSDYADFREAQFSGGADFREAQFKGVAFFSEARFSGGANFEKAQFSGNAWFTGAQFSGEAYFREAQFSDYADFREAQFSGGADFREAQFSGDAWFSEARFGGDADFTAKGDGGEADVFQRSSFAGARFGGGVTFENRRFRRASSFNSCVFEKAPSFHDCTLHQDTDFNGARFLDTESEGADRAYRTLKLAMENHRARQEQQMFYALEMESRMKAKGTPFFFKLFAALFLVASNFSQSVLLPLFWFGLASILFFVHYLDFLAALPNLAGDAPSLALKLAVDPIIRPFGSQFAIGPDLMKGLPHESLWNLTLLNRLQSILSYIFLTLGFLALRTRFKMG